MRWKDGGGDEDDEDGIYIASAELDDSSFR
jgi:hypothetical protein